MVIDKVIEIIANQLGADAAEINADTRLREDLKADSLDTVELIMAAEDEFGIEVEDEAVKEFVTVGDVAKYIESRQ